MCRIGKDPKILLSRATVSFQTICFLMAIGMAVIMFGRFGQNKSATSITYKKYEQTSEDQYPTFSICFKGSNFHWYQHLKIFDVFDLSFEQFERMLKGKIAFRYDYDLSSGLFRKIPTFINNGSDRTFNE